MNCAAPFAAFAAMHRIAWLAALGWGGSGANGFKRLVGAVLQAISMRDLC